MRIYNGKRSQIDLPLSSETRITVPPLSVSKDMMPSDYFLTLIAQSYGPEEVALIVAGPYEINMCAKNPACNPIVVQSLDEAIARFNSTPEKKQPELAPEPVKKEVEVEPPFEVIEEPGDGEKMPGESINSGSVANEREDTDRIRPQYNNYGGNKKKNKGNKNRPMGNVAGFDLGSDQKQA